MIYSQLGRVAVLLALLSTNLVAGCNRPLTCNDIVVIWARGSGETYGVAAHNAILRNIIPGLMAIDAEWKAAEYAELPYPAVQLNATNAPAYFASIEAGTTELVCELNQYESLNCANTKNQIVLLGFSQGAEVVLNSLIGYPIEHGKHTTLLPANVRSLIKAVTVFGDPNHVNPNLPPPNADQNAADYLAYQVSTGENGTGLQLPRENGGSSIDLNYPNAVVSYCSAGDFVCDSGSGSPTNGIHQNETFIHNVSANAFINQRVNS